MYSVLPLGYDCNTVVSLRGEENIWADEGCDLFVPNGCSHFTVVRGNCVWLPTVQGAIIMSMDSLIGQMRPSIGCLAPNIHGYNST